MRALCTMPMFCILRAYSATSLKSSSTRLSTLPILLAPSLRALCALVAISRMMPIMLLL